LAESSAPCDEAEPREHRQQQGESEQHVAQAAIERPPVEDEMQPEAAVHPSRRQQAELHPLLIRHPQVGHDAGVVGRHLKKLPGQPRVRGVTDQQDRQHEAERDAQELERRQTEGAPLVDRPERKQEMDGGGAIEQHRAGPARPDLDRDLETSFRGTERDETERVVHRCAVI
jgi:hypothetical protein